jgi:hypothetical protein
MNSVDVHNQAELEQALADGVTRITLRGAALYSIRDNHSEGLATRHAFDHAEGHVTIYTHGSGALTIASDSPDALRSLARAFDTAADELHDMVTSGKVAGPDVNGRPVPVVGGMS